MVNNVVYGGKVAVSERSFDELCKEYKALDGIMRGLQDAIATKFIERHELMEALSRARSSCRLRHGITTRQFAEMCGISPTKLCQWTSPSIEELGEPDIICRRSEHVCGLEGYNQMTDPPCPACGNGGGQNE